MGGGLGPQGGWEPALTVQPPCCLWSPASPAALWPAVVAVLDAAAREGRASELGQPRPRDARGGGGDRLANIPGPGAAVRSEGCLMPEWPRNDFVLVRN